MITRRRLDDLDTASTMLGIGVWLRTLTVAFAFWFASVVWGQEVVSWGDDVYGQASVPVGLTGVVQVEAGYNHNLALKSDGTVVAWGDDYFGQSTVPAGLSGVVQVGAGWQHSLALKSDGTVVAWGNNSYGQLDVPAGLSGVVQVAGGTLHSLALKSDGTVVAWGLNNYGQSTVPAGLSGVVQVAAGWQHSLALKSDGTVVAWGDNGFGQSNAPGGLSSVVQVAGGGYHCLALKSDGGAVAWGRNFEGQCNVPAGLSGVVKVSAGWGHSLALKSDGTAVAWGDDGQGQCNIPVVPWGVVQLDGGLAHSLALLVVPPSAKPDTYYLDASTTLSVAAPGVLGNDEPNGGVAVLAAPPAHSAAFNLVADGSFDYTPAADFHGIDTFVYKVANGSAESSTVTVALYVQPVLSSLTANLTTLVGGYGTTGKVSLSAPAPAGGSVVSLSSNSPKLWAPTTVKVLGGKTVRTFSVGTGTVASTTVATLTATLGAVTKTLDFTLNPGGLVFLGIVPSTMTGGASAVGTVKLSGAAPTGGRTVFLTSNSVAATVPASVIVPAGQTSKTFNVSTSVVATSTTAKVVARAGTVQRTVTLTINP